MGKKKRRRHKPTAQPNRLQVLADTILAGTISGLITAAILKIAELVTDRGAGGNPRTLNINETH